MITTIQMVDADEDMELAAYRINALYHALLGHGFTDVGSTQIVLAYLNGGGQA